MKLKLALLIFFLLIAFNAISQNGESYFVYHKIDTVKQVDLIDYFRKIFKPKVEIDNKDTKKIQFSLFPTESNFAEGRALVTTFNATFLLGEKANTNVSNVYFIPYISFVGKYGFELYPTIWLKKNSWNFVGEYFILNYPQDTWGLGGNTPSSNQTLVDYKQIRVHQSTLKGIFPNLAVGLGYQYDKHYNISLPDAPEHVLDSLKSDVVNNVSISSGLEIPIVFDSRKNTLNAKQGFYGSFNYRYNSTILGSDSDWSSLFIDLRKYFSIKNTRSVLALRSYYWTILSGRTPYLDLPSNDWEPAQGTSSRGIQQNRYRSNANLYFESEYRYVITNNGLIGGVLFANVVSASQFDTQNFEYWHPAAGFGLRVKFNKYSDVNVDLDFGFSKDYFTVYLNIGEMF
ncbi:BamA/TamA family outer membrane protein [Flavobacterium sp. N3904]|uniref:BamA/TamA family outer membrane protein n=1 Tax=Flavobacterium sp. N3904 TaxID=2986835 RepID=UPI00222508F5|nr:BamA/TamA family outer membrane protein [Flavobacterium sp. N3904]